MAVSDIGHPFQVKAWYWVEDSYGDGASGSTLPISKYIQDIKVGTGDKGKDMRSIESAVIIERISQTNEPVISIEYNPQVGDTMIDDCVDRSSCCTLQSLAFCFGANTCIGGDDATYYYGVGFKPSSVKIAGSKNEPYTVTIDYEGKSVTTSTSAIGVEPSALAGAIMQFNVAGSITKVGGFNPTGSKIAYITNSVDITIDHQLTGYTDHDSLNKSYLIEGTMDVSGTVDITLDGGGGMHFGEVIAMTDFVITVNMGSEGAVKLTLPGCNWDNSEVDINVSGEALMESAGFTCVPSACSNIVSTV
jgi:hypothetical protein